MPYDKRWDAKVEPKRKTRIGQWWSNRQRHKTMTLSGLIAWLDTKQPNEGYNYSDINDCLLSQYFRSRGYIGAFCAPGSMSAFGIFVTRRVPSALDRVAIVRPWTFGAALERARQHRSGM